MFSLLGSTYFYYYFGYIKEIRTALDKNCGQLQVIFMLYLIDDVLFL